MELTVDERTPASRQQREQRVTLGTSSLGAGTEPGSAGDAAAIATATALLGSRFARIDTSRAYAGGRSEEVLGAALSRMPERATAARIVTKIDADPDTGALDRDRVLRSFELSLKHLGLDRIELVHLHDPYSISYAEAEGPHGAIAGMQELRDSGAAGAIGIAAGPIPLMLRYVRSGAFDAVLTHNRYTLVDRTAVPLLREARSRGMTTFNAAPYGGGILATGVRPNASYGYRPSGPAVIEWVTRAQAICERHAVPLAAAALHFSVRSPLVDSTVVGVTRPSRLHELEALIDMRIPEEIWEELDAIGPTPDPLAEATR